MEAVGGAGPLLVLGALALSPDAKRVAWGDEDGRTLYVTALTSVYRIRTAVPGDRP